MDSKNWGEPTKTLTIIDINLGLQPYADLTLKSPYSS